MGIAGLDAMTDADLLKKLASEDESSMVRVAALKKVKDVELAKSLITSDESYRVIGTALALTNKESPIEGLKYAKKLTEGYHKPLISNLSEIFASSKDPTYLNFFETNVNKVNLYSFFNFMSQYGKLAKVASPERKVETAAVLKKIATEESNTYFKKYAASNLIKSLSDGLSKANESDKQAMNARNTLEQYMTQIVNSTTDERLRKAFSDYIEQP